MTHFLRFEAPRKLQDSPCTYIAICFNIFLLLCPFFACLTLLQYSPTLGFSVILTCTTSIISPIICLPFLLYRSSYIENMFLITLIFPKYYKNFEYIKMLKESYGVHPSMYLLDFIVNIMLHLLYHIFIHLSFLYSYIKFCNAFKSCRYRYSLS